MSSNDKSNEDRKFRSKRRCKRRYYGDKLPSSKEESVRSPEPEGQDESSLSLEESQAEPESSSFQLLVGVCFVFIA